MQSSSKSSLPEVVKEIEFKPDTPRDLPPSYLVSASYDGDRKAVLLKLYEPTTERIYFWYDNTGHKPYCLSDLSIEELEKIDRLMSHKGLDHFRVVEKKDLLTDQKLKMTKIVAKDPLAIGGRPRGCIRDIIPKAWEADIKYYENYLYDRRLIPGMLYEIQDGDLVKVEVEIPKEVVEEISAKFKGEPPELREYINQWIPLLQCPVPDFRRVAMDIEVYSPIMTHLPDPRTAEHPIICVSFVGSDGVKRALVLKRPEIEEGKIPSGVKVDYYDDEVKLIADTFKVLLDYPFVITFNGDEFDLSYLWHRALKLGFSREQVPILMGRNFALLKYGIHVDLCRFFFNKSIQVYTFGQKYREITLDEVGRELIGIGKLSIEKPIAELTYGELIEYCLRDSEIVYRLTEFSDSLVMKLIVMLARIAIMPIEDVTRLGVSNWITSRMYYEHRIKEALIPRPEDLLALKGITTTKAVIEGKKYKGAIVVEPTPGVHFDVSVLDFASLYPSIIKEWNLGYETILCPHPECRGNLIPETPYWVCKKLRSISNLLIGSLKDLRVKWYKPKSKDESLPKDERNLYEVIQQSLKVILNASYGVFGAEHFAFYCPPVAEATAAIGRYAMTKTIERARASGIEVVYGDTDSIFLKRPKREEIDELIRWSKSSLGLDLDIDKNYRYVAFSSRKKNYLGVHPDGSVDVKGLTGKKRHMPMFLKLAFSEMVRSLSRVSSEDEFEKAKGWIKEIVQRTYAKLKRNEYLPSELAINVMLRKLPERYTETTPQHVKAALLLRERGFELKPGDVIGFVKVKTEPGVKPVQLVKEGEVDVEKYVDYLGAAFEQVLDAIGLDFYSILGYTKLEYFLQ